jgi:hypothetical protein
MIKADVGDTLSVSREMKEFLGQRMYDANVTSFFVSALIAPLIACTTPEVAGIEPTYVTSDSWKRVAGCSDTPFKSVRFFEIRNAKRVPTIASQRAYAGLLNAAQIFSAHPAVNWSITYPSSLAKIETFIRLAKARDYRKNLADFRAVLFDMDKFEVPGTLWPGIPRPVADIGAQTNPARPEPRQPVGA